MQAAIEELQWPEFAARSAIRRTAHAAALSDTASTDTSSTGRSARPAPRSGAVRRAARHEHARSRARTRRWPSSSSSPKAAPSASCRCAWGAPIIGRTPDNDLQIDSRFVSRHHCQIITKPNACIVEDLNSTNGIVVKSKRVRRHNLNDGDVVTIGRHDLIYIDERTTSRNSSTGSHPALPGDDSPSAHGETTVL